MISFHLLRIWGKAIAMIPCLDRMNSILYSNFKILKKYKITLDQRFSTFFSSWHTKDQRKFSGTLVPKKFCKIFQKGHFFPKRIGKVRAKNLAAHLEEAHGTQVCRDTPVEKHCLRHT